MFRRNLLQDRNNLDYLLLHLDEDTVQRVLDLLSAASRIFVGGEGHAVYIAQAFAARLLALGFPAHSITVDLAGQAAISSGVQPDDVFVGIGMTAMTPGMSVMLKVARNLGAQTVGIVASLTHPIASSAEHILHAPVRTVGVMPSWTALAAVLHALAQALAVCKGEPTLDWVLRTDYFIRTYADALRHQLVSARDAIAEYSATAEEKAITETVN
jgi:DNA-binding MurR/RpiR family transcriptional regulator